jgi:formate hydrogenlyase subunit 3/multisubunit Na+/H+ antiporter MnhD subunit
MANGTPGIPKQNIIILAALEMPVMAAAAIRFAMTETTTPPQENAKIIWFVACTLVASFAVTVHLLRLMAFLKSREPVPEDDRKQALSFSIAVLVLAGGLVAIGPAPFEKMLG